MRRAASVALALIAGVIVSHQVLYARLLVPRLAQFRSVPPLVWLAVTSPIWLAGLASGASLRCWPEVALSALVAAMAIQTYEACAYSVSRTARTIAPRSTHSTTASQAGA